MCIHADQSMRIHRRIQPNAILSAANNVTCCCHFYYHGRYNTVIHFKVPQTILFLCPSSMVWPDTDDLFRSVAFSSGSSLFATVPYIVGSQWKIGVIVLGLPGYWRHRKGDFMFSAFDISCYIYYGNDTIELGHVARKKTWFRVYEQQSRRSDCASTQSYRPLC